ncbi:hypothetical protein P872_21345 [Rhodonellum psychrophilum GCM71 = DSM 17998]|uniref:Uncharacterized protein n=1 Tax=Rhodonellum psychrophilum GCM71 = DSM 17998 TaxID=1123057 RepID=U5BXT1_9BACT|nr:hypothetical protein P872_21345 [Rhodonellum psychrophilum GCM71 = DSM 17998]
MTLKQRPIFLKLSLLIFCKGLLGLFAILSHINWNQYFNLNKNQKGLPGNKSGFWLHFQTLCHMGWDLSFICGFYRN